MKDESFRLALYGCMSTNNTSYPAVIEEIERRLLTSESKKERIYYKELKAKIEKKSAEYNAILKSAIEHLRI